VGHKDRLTTKDSILPKPDRLGLEAIAGSDELQRDRNMDRSLISSVAWNATGDWVSQILSWLSFLIVIRLLTPADFGVVNMALVLLPFLQYISTFGIGRAIVTLRTLTDEQLAQLNTVGLLLGIGGFVLAAILAKPFALFFKTPALTPVVIVICIALIPSGLQVVSGALLNRDMRFRTLSLLNGFCAVVSAAFTLLFAWLGWKYWALVLGNLVATFFRCVFILRSRPQKYAVPHIASIREPLQFGGHVIVSLIALNCYQRLDNLTAGRLLGPAALGLYGMAWTLANVPLEKVTSLVTTVVPSYLAQLQEDPAALRRYLRNLTEGLALATFPATVGLGLVARELIPLALGRKWIGVIPSLEVLSIYAAFRSIVALLPKLLTAVGNPRFVMWNDLAALVILPTSFYVGSRWGIVGIAWGWVVGYPIIAVPLYRKTFLTIGMKRSEYMRALRPALDATIVMTAAVLSVKYVIPAREPLPLRLACEIITGVICYGGTLLLGYRQRVAAFVNTAKSFRRR
jgi:teichuronic acid exporter